MRLRNLARLHGFWLTRASAPVLPGKARAGWGDENWGAMMWNEIVSLPVLPVLPALGIVGLTLLAMGLAATAAWTLRKPRPALGLTLSLVLLGIPLAVAAGTLTVPHTFANGDNADANQVNANFDTVETAVNDNDSRITGSQSTADTAVANAATSQSTADTAVANAATSQSTADTAVANAAAAQSTADTAVTNAAAAQTTADTAVTNAAAAQATADGNQAVRSAQGPHDRPGTDNTAVGANALSNNTFISEAPLGVRNTAIGSKALYSNTVGNNNTAVGARALEHNINGFGNTATGRLALYSNTSGFRNTAGGEYALQSNETGGANTALGQGALLNNTAGSYNTALGQAALEDNTLGHHNTAVGRAALQRNTWYYNTAVGSKALQANVTGTRNAALGRDALRDNNGSLNTAVGEVALAQNTLGDYNTAIGARALRYSQGNGNIALGRRAGYVTTGDYNIVIGTAGVADEDGTIRIGTPGTHLNSYIAGALHVGNGRALFLTNQLKLNHSHASYDVWIQGNGSPEYTSGDVRNLAVLGRTDTDTLVLNYGGEYTSGTEIQSNLTVSGCITGSFCSDAQLKANIQSWDEPVLEQVLQLQVSTYEWRDDPEQGMQIGLIAQEVEKLFPEVVSTGSKGLQKGLSCTGLNAVTIQAVKELKAEKDAEIAALQQRLALVEGLSERLVKLEAQSRVATAFAEESVPLRE